METGVPPSVWWAEDERDLVTALHLLYEAGKQQGKPSREVASG